MFAKATNPAVRAYDTADTKNDAGHSAWNRPLEERTVQLLMCNTISNTFYVGEDKLAKETDETFRAILASDTEFFAKAIVHARNVGCVRLAPIVGLVYLSTAGKEHRAHFHNAFAQTIRTPHDLATFVQWSRRAGIRKGLGQGLKATVNVWLNGLTEYHAIKYPLESGKEGFSLRDIIRVTRPVPKDDRQKAIFRWIVKGELEGETLPQITAFEKLKKATSKDEIRQLIENGRIPHEVATGIVKPDTATWVFIMHQMPHFALLRNLNTLSRHGVLKNDENVAFVVSKLTDEKGVKFSKVLPFRYFEALQAYVEAGNADNRIVGALGKALELSFVNVPEIEGRVLIGVDTSDSMTSAIGGKSKARYIDVAAIFAAALFKKSARVEVMPFDTTVHNFGFNQSDSILSIAKGLSSYGGGGTDVGSFVRKANSKRSEFDVVIGVTDNMEWMTAHGGWGSQSNGFYGEWKTFKQSNPKARAFLVRIDPYKGAAAPPEDKDVTLIYGWSPVVLEFIALAQKGFGAQVEAVRKVDLTRTKKSKTENVAEPVTDSTEE